MPRNKSLFNRIEQLENRGSVIIDHFDWEDHEPSDEELFNEKHYYLIHTGQMSWEEYFYFQKEHGLHAEFETYADYRKDLLENGW